MYKHICCLTYITIDAVIEHMLTTSPTTLLVMVDIKKVFRPLSVHPANCHMLVKITKFLLTAVSHSAYNWLLKLVQHFSRSLVLGS